MNHLVRLLRAIRITVPASRTMRAKVLADYRHAHGLDLPADERRDRIRRKAGL